MTQNTKTNYLTPNTLIPIGSALAIFTTIFSALLYLRSVETSYTAQVGALKEENIRLTERLKGMEEIWTTHKLTHEKIRHDINNTVKKDDYLRNTREFREALNEVRLDVKILLQRQHRHSTREDEPKKGE